MSVAEMVSIAANFPALQRLHGEARPSPTAEPDRALVQLCLTLYERQQGQRHFDTVDPRDWERANVESVILQDLICRIADVGAVGRSGLRAKALTLRGLLDEGGGKLYQDAATPDLLAWSLVRDILAD
jgi:hypothetical protein